jgi:hypothetical protein
VVIQKSYPIILSELKSENKAAGLKTVYAVNNELPYLELYITSSTGPIIQHNHYQYGQWKY